MGVGIEPIGFLRFLSEGLDHADSVQGIPQHGIEGGRTAPLLGVHAPQFGEHEFEDTDDQRHGEKHDQRQFPVHDEQKDGEADEVEAVDDQIRHAVNIEGVDAIRIVIHPIDQTAGGILIEKAQGQPLHGGKNIQFHPAGNPGGHGCHISVLDDTDSQRNEGQTEHHAQHQNQLLPGMPHAVGGNNPVVQDLSVDDGGQKGDARGSQHTDQADAELPFEGLEVGQQSFHQSAPIHAVGADAAALILIDAAALGAAHVELIEDGIVLSHLIPAQKPLYDVKKGEQPLFAGVGAVSRDERGTPPIPLL